MQTLVPPPPPDPPTPAPSRGRACSQRTVNPATDSHTAQQALPGKERMRGGN